MDSVALFVDFDDVYDNLRKKSLPVSPTLLAQSLRRTARAFGSPLKAYACADWRRYPQMADPTGKPIPSAHEAFEQEGFEVLSCASRHEAVWRMEEKIFKLVYDEASPPKTFILVTNDGQFTSAANRLQSLSYQIRLWTVGDDLSSPITALGQVITPLEELLDLQAKTMALFVDLENIAISLSSLGFMVDPEALAKGLRSHAQKEGSLVEAYAYADWQKLPAAFDAAGRNLMAEAQRTFELSSIETRYLITVAGKNTADMRIADDIRDLLEDRNPPDVFIIASGDRDFTPVIDTLIRSQKEVVIWGVEGCTSASLSRLARVEYIQAFLPMPKRGQAQPAGVGESSQSDVATTLLPNRPDDGEPARPTLWTKLVMILDDLMKRNSWRWVSLSRATIELAKLKEFGPTEDDARYALNQAVARGIILKERIQNPNPNYPEQFVWAFRPSEDSRAVIATRLISERILDIMRYGLGRMEYVAFSYLQTQLARDRALTQYGPDLDEEGRTQWINFLISEGLIHASRRPHHRNPGDLVTALTLPSSPSSSPRQSSKAPGRRLGQESGQESDGDEGEGRRFGSMGLWTRLVISIDSFSARYSMEWAPLITLRQRLATFGREEMETVLRAAQESGDLVIQEYANPNKPYPTKGASLNYNSEIVKTVFAERDSILSSLARTHAGRGTFTSQTIRAILAGEATLSDERISLWLSILVSEKLVSCAPAISGQPRTYQLNLNHPVVGRFSPLDEGHSTEKSAEEEEISNRQDGRTLTSLQQAL